MGKAKNLTAEEEDQGPEGALPENTLQGIMLLYFSLEYCNEVQFSLQFNLFSLNSSVKCCTLTQPKWCMLRIQSCVCVGGWVTPHPPL